jgi:hypothetical protein
MKSWMAILILVFTLNTVSAQDSDSEEAANHLVIKPYQTNQLSALEEQNINKTILLVSTKQKDFQLSLSPDVDFEGVKTSVFSVTVEIVEDEKKYKIHAILSNLKKNNEVFRVTREHVEKHSIQRETEIALHLLFRGVDKEKIADKKIIPPTAKQGSKAQVADSGLDEFKKRILAIKNALNTKFKQILKIQKEQEAEEKEKEKLKEEAIKSQEEEAQPKTTTIVPEKEVKQEEVALINLESFSYLGVGYWDHDIKSVYIIDTNSYIPLLNFSYKKGFFFSESKSFYHLYDLNYGRPMEKYEIDISPMMSLSGGLGYKNDRFRFQTEIQLTYHTMTYASLAEQGAGLEPAEHTHLWADWHIGLRNIIGNFPVKLNLFYGQLLSGSLNYSGFEGAQIIGSRYGVEFLVFKVWKMLSISGGLYRMNIDLQRNSPLVIGDFSFETMKINGTSFNLVGVYTF